MGLLLLFDRCKNKIVRNYRNAVFRKRIHCPHKGVSLVGDVTLINTNIEVGQNVVIYPGCMFYGDGPIKIGNNVTIGNQTILYSSKARGGHDWR